jgi:hypothetical protein
MIPFGHRGSASTDPNDGSLWLYGSFARNRLAGLSGPGVWGTSVANYALSFPAVDPYNNNNAYYADVPPTHPSGFFPYIQIAKNQGLGPARGSYPANCDPNSPGTPPILPPPDENFAQQCFNFQIDDPITRAEMSYWVVRSLMDEAQVSAYLLATGGDPNINPAANSFADTVLDSDLPTLPWLSKAQMRRYIEVMYRRGYTKGCQSTFDVLRKYCPVQVLTRGEMSAFLIRAKMNNVFPTSLSGIQSALGDNFGLFQVSTPYFSDVPASHPFFLFIQKMRELRISNGTSPVSAQTCNPTTGFCTGGTFTPDAPAGNLTRGQIVTFVVRAFFL